MRSGQRGEGEGGGWERVERQVVLAERGGRAGWRGQIGIESEVCTERGQKCCEGRVSKAIAISHCCAICIIIVGVVRA